MIWKLYVEMMYWLKMWLFIEKMWQPIFNICHIMWNLCLVLFLTPIHSHNYAHKMCFIQFWLFDIWFETDVLGLRSKGWQIGQVLTNTHLLTIKTKFCWNLYDHKELLCVSVAPRFFSRKSCFFYPIFFTIAFDLFTCFPLIPSLSRSPFLSPSISMQISMKKCENSAKFSCRNVTLNKFKWRRIKKRVKNEINSDLKCTVGHRNKVTRKCLVFRFHH